jgi:CDGSH-type Zn-finger protein
MTEPKMTQKFPYVKDEKPGKYSWCACGHSKNQPYCDGSHAKLNTGISPIVVELTEAKKVAWCGCRQSKTKPYCDGTHKHLS